MVCDFEAGEVERDVVEVALFSDEVEVQVVLKCGDSLHDHLISDDLVEFEGDRLDLLS